MLLARLLPGAALWLVVTASGAHAGGFTDPMVTPAIANMAPAAAPLIAIAPAGDHLVAVGPRGMVVTSDRAGQSWTQALVPVESDLVAVQFPDALNGWAVGHNGVILHSADGGKTWVKQLDGSTARAAFEDAYKRQIAAGNAALTPFLQQIQLNFDAGPTLPWLSVLFTDDRNGLAIGSFGDIAITQDGGATWQPWLEHIDNPNFYDLDSIRSIAGTLYIAGEQGSVWRYNQAKQKFETRATAYDGSLFGITGSATTLIAFGMRGNIFRSTDQGKTWTQSVDTASASIMSGTLLPSGQFALVNADGGVLLSGDDGKSFHLATASFGGPLTDIVARDGGQLVLTGLAGIQHAAD